MKICKYDASHINKMAAMSIYGKKIFKNLQNRQADCHENWYAASRTPAHHSYAPNFEEVDGAYCFWSVRGCVRASHFLRLTR